MLEWKLLGLLRFPRKQMLPDEMNGQFHFTQSDVLGVGVRAPSEQW